MKKLFLRLLLLLMAACALIFVQPPLQAQTPTAVTITVTDVNGLTYSFAKVSAQLIPSTATPTVIVNGIPTQIGGQVNGGADINGNASMNLFCNNAGGGCSVISPSGTQWQITATAIGIPPPAGTGPQACSTTVTITNLTQTVALTGCPALSKIGGSLNLQAGANIVISGSFPNQVISSLPFIVQSGLLAEYRILPTETPAALVDYSLNGNTAIGTVGTAPTIIAGTGGINVTGNGAVILPAALNSAATIQACVGYQNSANINNFNAIVMGNGGGASTPHATGLMFAKTNPIVVNQTGRLNSFSNSTFNAGSMGTINGIGCASLVMGASSDTIYINGTLLTDAASAFPSAGAQNVGSYQLGGAAAGSGAGSQTYFTGQIYYIVFYNRALSTAEITQNFNAMQVSLINRGLTFNSGQFTNDTSDLLLMEGDSITAGNGAASSTVPSDNVAPPAGNSLLVYNTGQSGQVLSVMQQMSQFRTDNLVGKYRGRAVCYLWAGTNDLVNGQSTAVTGSQFQAWARNRRIAGCKTLMVTMLSRGSAGVCNQDTNKNAYNAILRFSAENYADVFMDAASSALGADGGCTNATLFQADNIHPSPHSYINIITPMLDWNYAAAIAPKDFSQAATYSSTATAATAITAASETTNTVTLTFASNPFTFGQCIVVTGVTPAGYNSPANQCWYVRSATATQVTYFNFTTGLGAGTVFGTAVTSQEQYGDVYATLGQCTTCTHTLQTCVGRTQQSIYRRITSTSAWTITPAYGGETINGGATFTAPTSSGTNNPIVRLDSILTSPSAAGCTWKASLQ